MNNGLLDKLKKILPSENSKFYAVFDNDGLWVADVYDGDKITRNLNEISSITPETHLKIHENEILYLAPRDGLVV